MKYPITPDYLSNCANNMIDLYRWLEQYMIQAVCEQLEWTGDFNASALEIIRELQRRGMPLEAVERKIRQVTGMSQAELDKVFDNAVELNNQYYTAVGDKLGLVLESVDSLAMQMEIDAIRMQTGESMRNLTRSMGFGMRGMDGSIVISDVQETYQNILDKAEMKVLSGTESYQEAIRGGVKEMADSGLVGEWVDYLDESGNVYHRNRVDVAVRRAVMTGVTQVSSKYTEAAAQDVDSPLREISAHRGARDIDGPNGWENHKRWQGKVYSLNTGDKYPNIYSATGWGTVTGLEGANCRHMHFLFVEGVSERTYTDAELKKIDRPDFEYQGRKYTAYEATQKQRQIETALRKLKRRRDAFKASGDKDAYTEAQARFRALLTEYKAFSHAADLPEQMFRIT